MTSAQFAADVVGLELKQEDASVQANVGARLAFLALCDPTAPSSEAAVAKILEERRRKMREPTS